MDNQATSAPAHQPTILELASSEAARKEVYSNIILNIIAQQSLIIGPALAVEQAQKVQGLSYDPVSKKVIINGNGSLIIDKLIEQYRDFFGHAAVEVCKEAAAKYLQQIPVDQTPSLLRV
ncbi:MAG: hypothetical protein MUF85_02195 [Patescibacteria group bacterium]|jgi:hypothetical protein|nr:hypothetical protein [Patescibacteria group bacterium]